LTKAIVIFIIYKEL